MRTPHVSATNGSRALVAIVWRSQRVVYKTGPMSRYQRHKPRGRCLRLNSLGFIVNIGSMDDRIVSEGLRPRLAVRSQLGGTTNQTDTEHDDSQDLSSIQKMAGLRN